MHLSIALITAAVAVVVGASPLEKRRFPTCDTKNQGSRAAALSIADSLAQTDGVITVTHDETILAQLTLDDGVYTTVSAFSDNKDTQSASYADVASLITYLANDECKAFGKQNLAPIWCLKTNDYFCVHIYGDHQGAIGSK